MESWPSPVLTHRTRERFGPGPAVRIYDTAANQLVDATPAAHEARLYACGITPYDATHLGHALMALSFDTLNRAWRSAGFDVRYVQNVTDVDEPLLERAALTGEKWTDLAQRQTQLYRDDMTALRIIGPDALVGATETVDLVADLVMRLRDAGAVYAVEDDLYFSVAEAPDFGRVSHFDRDTMFTWFREFGGDPNRPGKRDPLDCLVWRALRPDEPSWSTVLGEGRPGWHIECSAIATTFLGLPIDVQGGGSDLIFPHHEMCAAQVETLDQSEPFARAFVHTGMIGYEGHKMSKSLGNLVIVSRLRQDTDAQAIRLGLLSAHYRSDWEWTQETLDGAVKRLARWREGVMRQSAPDATDLVHEVRDALADDLDTPRALRAVDAWCAADTSDDVHQGNHARVVADLLDECLGIDVRAAPQG